MKKSTIAASVIEIIAAAFILADSVLFLLKLIQA